MIAESQNFARDLINEPGAVVTPEAIAERAGASGAAAIRSVTQS